MNYDHKQFHDVSRTMQQYHGITEDEAIEELINMIKDVEREQFRKGFLIAGGLMVVSLIVGLALYLSGVA